MSKYARTITKKNDGLSNNKLRAQAAQDIAAIAQEVLKLTNAHNELAKAAQNELNTVGNRLDDISVVLQAISTLLGVDKVNEAARNIRIEISEKDIAAQEASVAKAVEEGQIKVADTVTETCLLVTTIVRADGSQVYPRKSYMPFGTLKPEIKAIAKDKKVGDKFELPTGAGTMTILEVYENVPSKDEEKAD